ncbi:hypothetical protein Godav_011139 [Gossypium davidsonii]|uniref:Uncharacterized protein n=2 Tax=Gossypium TaxID=3633 RepID=A0A7J8RAA3_GOSDV|nr:hypothetical protein [Gossypium davidsonii]MBA0645335.1 hypothetical protein [Gossypium klotzschianum]
MTLNLESWAKARASWFLEARALREAGLTEQRKPPTHNKAKALREACFTEQQKLPAHNGPVHLGPRLPL